ncbi:MAG: hypothetical protein KAU17_13935 [Spirochaetales bacterium]|jgi:hypothetical protein|nr:hypothetical protein [Spirochaetales bacterium]
MPKSTLKIDEIEKDLEFDMEVIDLVVIMEEFWRYDEPYPGNPYNHNRFKQYYSDHNPIVFQMISVEDDD